MPLVKIFVLCTLAMHSPSWCMEHHVLKMEHRRYTQKEADNEVREKEEAAAATKKASSTHLTPIKKWQDVTPFTDKAVAFTLASTKNVSQCYTLDTKNPSLLFGFIGKGFINPGHPVWAPDSYEENPKPCYKLYFLTQPRAHLTAALFLNDAQVAPKKDGSSFIELRAANSEECAAMLSAIAEKKAHLHFLTDTQPTGSPETIAAIKAQGNIT